MDYRIDYVERNYESLKKELSDIAKKNGKREPTLVCVTKRQEGYSLAFLFCLSASYAIFAISRAYLSLLVSKPNISFG